MDDRDKHSLHSTLRENIIEHLFVGAVLQRLWQRDVVDAEILKSEFDAGGYDLVLTCKNVTRHIQLKVSRVGGKRSDVNVSMRLADKPSGCVIWITVDDELDFREFRLFAGAPGSSLPDISQMKVVKHTKGDAQGKKNDRLGHRLVSKKHFQSTDDLGHLLTLLLGSEIWP
ncbi:hypothetical protein [Rhizobium sp. BG4]|uniref:hypothetical protein n=1 Tax=Rhizobium sp. BG4 TaxID=2613770 RepID=UPI00193D4DB6|nr:hypothetical protein [Rhizobium sp. BG4]QRM42244.1 hypothetical protein F2982_01715 [Rhizobium sp. BG4]